jgi:type IV secretion system protein VirD4
MYFHLLRKSLPKLVGSVMTDISTRFQLLVSDQVRAVTTRNDIDFVAMTNKPVALYLSIPRRYAERYQPLLACFMMQMFSVWEQIASTTGERGQIVSDRSRLY